MHSSMKSELERQAARLAELDFLLAQSDVAADPQQSTTLARERSQLAPTVEAWLRHQQREADIEAARAMLDDAEMAPLAREEISAAQAEMEALEAELERLLRPQDPDDARYALLEVRAGTGGDESALFAGDLLRMYTRYASARGWPVQLLSESPAPLGGYKEAVLRIAADGAYGVLRFESGGHRVQRVPVTEAQGRIHTSAATVAVMPEPDEAQPITLDMSEVRIDTFRASGAGGQHIQKTDSAVRAVHLPTGLVAECQDSRSQHSNKAQALRVLQARLQEREQDARAAEEAATRRALIGTGDRSDRIRTYNFPQGRVTDHRIKLTLHALPQIMDGDLQPLLGALRQAWDAAQNAPEH